MTNKNQNKINTKTSRTSSLEREFTTELYNLVKSRFSDKVWEKTHSSLKQHLLMSEQIIRNNQETLSLDVEVKEVVSRVAFGDITTPSPIVSKSPGGASQEMGPRRQHLDPTEQPIARKNQICTQGGSQGACHQNALNDKGTADCHRAFL